MHDLRGFRFILEGFLVLRPFLPIRRMRLRWMGVHSDSVLL